MFTRMKNIDTAFRYIRSFSVLLIIACMVISGYALYSAHLVVSRSEQKIFVLANGKALEAYAADRKDNIPVEARDHVKSFHHWFFTLDPDDQVIQTNITKALYLADHSAKEQYDNLKENNYYSNIISGNISQELDVDSVYVNISSYPYYFRCLGHQKIIRPSSISTRSLITEGYLRNVTRSDNNPHGFLIEKWRTLENKDLKTENR
ncbi:MAG: conjugative transposon protein TraK [Thermoproteota archaeon]|nr:conjugative transposon protein TraK [Thermoproteota archaeon]